MPTLPTDLEAWVRGIAATQDPRVVESTPVVPLVTRGLPTRPVAPDHSQVYICAGVIVKLHGEGTDAGRLRRRLAGIGGQDMDRLWIQPLRYAPIPAPGNRLEALKGDRKGQYSIRINDQFRICFRWSAEGPEQVEIVDYH